MLIKRIKIFLSFALLLSLVISISLSAFANNEETLMRTSSGEGVFLEVEFLNPDEMDSDELLFRVYMTTHSGNLLDKDFENKIEARNESGELSAENISWQWESKSSHHPVAMISIKNDYIEEEKFYTDQTGYIELRINDIRGYDHLFNWNINQSNRTLAYIPNAASGTVSVIDIDAEKLIDTIEIGEEASHGIEITNDGRFLYSGDFQNGLIQIYDLENNSLYKTLEIKSTAHGIDMSPDGKYILVASGSASEVTVIDTETQEIIKVIEEGIGKSPSHIDFHPEGKYALLTNLESNDVSIISIPDFEVIKTIPVGEGPNEGRIAPDGKFAYTANWISNSISVIDLSSFELVDEISVGEGTHGVIVSADSKKIWTANRITNNVAIIDAEKREVERYIASGEYTNHLEFTPDGKRVVVTNARDNEAIIIDAKTYEILARIEVGKESHEITFLTVIK
ncbi:YVTN family beta-propeller repeat protein [Natronospora cellulosivora (SeqCode)]